MSDAALTAWIMGGLLVLGGGIYVAVQGLPNLPGLAPTFDATSEATIKDSLTRMSKGMSEDDKKGFAADCMAVAMFSGPNGGNFGEMMRKSMASAFSRGEKPAPEWQTAEIMKPLHGLTVSQIHAKAEEVRQRIK